MSKKSFFILCGLVLILAGCSAPLYLSNQYGVSFTIDNPIAKAVFRSSAASGARFLAGTANQTIKVTVSAADLAAPVSAWAVSNGDGTYNATLTVPLGSGRTVLVEAFDASGSVYASVSSTIDLVGGMAPVSLKLQPASNSAVELSIDAMNFSMTPGKVSLYKRTVTDLQASFGNSGYFFGANISLDAGDSFSQNDMVSMIDEFGAEILSPRHMLNNSLIPAQFFDSNTTMAPKLGTFYLIAWGDTAHTGTFNSFPSVTLPQ